jgi:hypothetical protein
MPTASRRALYTKPTSKLIEEVADRWVFLVDQLRVEP